MPPESHGRPGYHRDTNMANGPVDNGPPRSTLAAQLVENISPTAKATRPDETDELKRLFSIIEKVKNEPDLLQTPEEQVEHNHMLIYVYARVVLESLKWDDPFADQAALQADALKAINFIKVTVKETPDVLEYTTDGTSFLIRGTEPLWLWILPKVLRMLGHAKWPALSPVIEDFCRFLLLPQNPNRTIRTVATPVIRYFQGVVGELLESLRTVIPSNQDVVIDASFPPLAALEQQFPQLSIESFQGHTFRVHSVTHALRLTRGILSAVASSLTRTDFLAIVSPSHRFVPWLLDSLLALREIQKRWDAVVTDPCTPVIQSIMDIGLVYSNRYEAEATLRTKIDCALVLFCCALVDKGSELLSESFDGMVSRQTFCLAMAHVVQAATASRAISRLTKSQLLGAAEKLAGENAILGDGTDFSKSVELLKAALKDPTLAVFGEVFNRVRFGNSEVQRAFQALQSVVVQPPGPAPPPSKRRRISAEPAMLVPVLHRLSELLNIPTSDNLGGLDRRFLDDFGTLNDRERCAGIDLLAYVTCASDNTMEGVAGDLAKQSRFRCSLCKGGGKDRPLCLDITAKSKSTACFTELVRLPSFLESKRPRVVAMIALRRVVSHSVDSDFLDLETSAAGQWCLQSLQSSVRELRIAAGRTLSAFLGASFAKGVPDDIAQRNRLNTIGILKSLSDKDQPHLHETCIMAWGQTGRVVPDEDLDFVLSQLMEFLGHRNQIVSAFAVNEILNLANSRRRTPKSLLDPFWKTLAFSVVKDLVSKPQTTRIVADLFQISVPELVLHVQRHALPWLVLSKRRDVIQKIAEFRGEKEAFRPCADTTNLSSILALLLSQDVPAGQVEMFTMALLRHISPHFNNSSLVEMLRAESVQVILELLKAAGDAEESRKPLVHSAFVTMTNLLLEGKEARKKTAVRSFLHQYALGITARLTEVINDNVAKHPPVQEQRRCIRALEELVKLCESDIKIARPQISSFLLTALNYNELRASAFQCWVTMIRLLDVEDIKALLDTTFVIIGTYWTDFDSAARQLGRDMIESLLENQSEILEDRINALPSLGHIPELAALEKRLRKLRRPLDNRAAFGLFAKRLGHANSGVVLQALTELAAYLRRHQGFLQTSAISEHPDPVVTDLARALLDCSAKYNGIRSDITTLCVECTGLVGCLDHNRLDTVREQHEFVLLHNFEDAMETTEFVLFLLEEVLVKSFLSATDPSFQGFLSYVLQELLEKCNFKAAVQLRDPTAKDLFEKWLALPDLVREVLLPFMTSGYRVQPMAQPTLQYPVFPSSRSYAFWLRSLVVDLLYSGQNTFAEIIFEPLSRVIRVKDLAVAEFLLPYLVVHVIVGDKSAEGDRRNVLNELLSIFEYQLPDSATSVERENLRLYSEAVFKVLDYCKKWVQRKKAHPSAKGPEVAVHIKRVQRVLDVIPPELISRRAMECKQYARALFHLEPFVELGGNDQLPADETARNIADLQCIYTQIDEPDGLEGLSAQLLILDFNQQILSHRKAGRWTEAQTWYQNRLAKEPTNIDVQLDLLTCLRESGQHDVLLNHVDGMMGSQGSINRIVPFAVEASWTTGRWDALQKYLDMYNGRDITEVFNLGIAHALLCLRNPHWFDNFPDDIRMLREKVAASLSYTATSSLQACHDAMLQAHVLTELEHLGRRRDADGEDPEQMMVGFSRRLEIIGASFANDKQYVLGIRRAAMELMRPKYESGHISRLWLTTAHLARKAGSMQQSFDAVLHANELGDESATIDNARLLWKEGHHRKAIQVLENAIRNDNFIGTSIGSVAPTSSRNPDSAMNLLTARAHLLLAKWLDSAGQTHAAALRQKYQDAAKTHTQWEKGHYYLGRHYKKILESEKALRPDGQSDAYLTGETAKLVIENYLRSLNFGTKYLYQTLPRILTLWMELGAQVDKAPEGKVSVSKELSQRKRAQLSELHKALSKNLIRMPAYIFYTALPQVVARIAHPNTEVFTILEQIIVKVIDHHPRQALWCLLGVTTSRQAGERKTRGRHVLAALQAVPRKAGAGAYDLKQLIRMGEKMAEQLLMACANGDFQSNRTTVASITRDLMFNHKCTPCPLVVPVEACLTATLPTLTENVKKHKAFSGDIITIDSFEDEVLVLGSLAKPRKLTARGSDGKLYGLLIKPKDDLRTDQRLMEFNGMINRSFKRDAESSRRQLYIKTYAVTPLNEECGIIEWVDGLKTLRDILLALYRSRGIAPNYMQIAALMKDAASSDSNIGLFTDKVLGMFPAVLSQWFVARFTDPSAWFAARLKYTRSCAVMSMVGTILGLGDRHGENVLLEEGSGGVFHVDFNCLFDKGLTFAQPERVPFRLTHNMVKAMGIYGYDGPFRKCSELTLGILRQQEETLMTILEAFIYDPTLDLQKDKKRKHKDVGGPKEVQLNPQAVVDSIKRKVRGLLPGESIPLGVEGQVQELIQQAVNPRHLAAMYIGWCPFL